MSFNRNEHKSNIEGQVTISRPSGHDCDYISIELTDKKSRNHITTIKISYSEFAQAVTGLAYQPCVFDISNIQYVGKKRITDKLKVRINRYASFENLKEAAIKAAIEQLPEGWILDPYLGSQNSILYIDDYCVANFTIYKYTDNENDNDD